MVAHGDRVLGSFRVNLPLTRTYAPCVTKSWLMMLPQTSATCMALPACRERHAAANSAGVRYASALCGLRWL